MKKIAFVLAVLLFTAPAWAAVTITATQVGSTDQVEISYVSDGNLPRAFGLDITVTDGNITACSAEVEGECTAAVRGYGIFPGSIQIDAGGNVTDFGNPAAVAGATGALGGIDTNGITVELGSLYQGPNEPALSGVLCTITVSQAPTTVRIAGNAARCGSSSPAHGVVMEDWLEVPVVTYVDGPVSSWDCFDSGDPAYADWVAAGKPDCWCASKGYPRQCHGDTDNIAEGKGGFWVFSQDLITLLNGWGKAMGGLNPGEICADFDHSAEGKGLFRVFSQDLIILLNNWGTAATPPDCPY
ncbi:MAG: hypothetical protein ACYS6W_13350 [Planctomycetota bacterium]